MYVGVSPFVATPEGQKETPAAYLISNKTNNLVEGEHRVLGMAIRMAKEMQDILDDELENKQESMNDLPQLDSMTNEGGSQPQS